MRIRLRERDPQTRRWVTLLDEQADPGSPVRAGPLALNEGSDIALSLHPDDPAGFEARVLVGGVVVASTRELDRTDFLLRPADADEGAEYFTCSGRLLRDWVGQTDLQVVVRGESGWQPVLEVAPLHVAAGKLAQEEFESLCAEVANHSAAALLDVYGKTFFGLEPERKPGEGAPVAVLQRVRQAIDQIGVALHEIASQPAYRLKTRRVREPAIAELGVSDLTLEEACLDPTLAVRHRSGVVFREHVRETADPHFNLAENRTLTGFLLFLGVQLADLEARIRREIALRQERRAHRHRPGPDGGKSWWETEDLPRIEELKRLLESLKAMQGELARLRRYPFLPPGGVLREVPPSTPLFRSHRAYASAFRVLMGHFTSFRVRLDDTHLLTRGKSLPVLYEWWCVLEVLRVLQGCLRRGGGSAEGRGSPFRRLEAERACFVVEFAADQAVDFEDENGRLVRLRYVPSYRPESESGGLGYGLLSPEVERTPDVALEVFGLADRSSTAPELVIVFDAKYTSDPHRKKLDEVRLKYGKIGLFRTGRVLSRQVWALVPGVPAGGRGAARVPEWASLATVDNAGFWSDAFDMNSWVAGVVQAKPGMRFGRSPLESLIRLLLRRCGVMIRG